MFKDFKPIFVILLRFMLIYLAFLGLYQFYLNTQKDDLDVLSKWVLEQVIWLLNVLGHDSKIVYQPEYQTGWIFVDGDYRSRMVEGCNAVSVIILFLAFIFAFYKGKKTFVFAIVGLFILHIMNVLRIAGLNIVFTDYPQYSKTAHNYFFPAAIYGSVVLLWLIWIKFFALKNRKDEKNH
ncbi:MAG: exosortase family protein XrtF [Flavobacteriaceae bacterium]|jgi:exosortase family protein XrtF|nr:exosortase family protein XrtF [Flavobacteriaceae bacterium]